jgi:lipocalin-like protein
MPLADSVMAAIVCQRQASDFDNNMVPTRIAFVRAHDRHQGRNDMNWRHIVLPAATSFGLAMLPQAAVAQGMIKDQIVGAWAIVSQVQTMKDGTTRNPAGMNPKGLNVFTADGQFVVLFMRDDLPKIVAGDRQKATGEEARAVV